MLRAAVLVLVAVVFAGCTAPGPTNEIAVPAGEYRAAFDATREVLREYRFRLARVDAAAGVVSTQEKPSAGLATPWDLEQSTAKQEVDDFLNQQRREVRVTFEREGGGAPIDDAPATGQVWVTVYRMQNPGVRVPPRVVTMPTNTRNPALEAQGLYGQYEVPVTRDEELECRLAKEISVRSQSRKPPPSPQPEPHAEPQTAPAAPGST